MTAVFSEKEKKQAYATRRRMLIAWWTALAVTVGAITAMAIINSAAISRSGDRTLKVPFMLASMVLSAAFGCGSVFFFGIKYRLTSRYCRMLTGMKRGIKDRSHGKFVAIDPKIIEKDGVFFYGLILDCEPMKRGDIGERRVLVEKSHALPQMDEGDEIRFITHANILVAYEFDMEKVFDKLNERKTAKGEEK